MSFLHPPKKEKVIRTNLYGDQEFSYFELEILHTPILQRLYHLKQLGFADKVYPDAVHSRFNHILGVPQVAERMSHRLSSWLNRSPDRAYVYAREGPQGYKRSRVKSGTLARHIEKHVPALRLMGILHDLTHAAFGHTLEDEVRAFAEKHDEPQRQARFFDTLFAQLVLIWAIQLAKFPVDPKDLDSVLLQEWDASFIEERLREVQHHLGDDYELLSDHLYQLEFGLKLLLHLDSFHRHDMEELPAPPELLISRTLNKLWPDRKKANPLPHRDIFFLDIIGNTICADLLDYVRRDAANSGLRVQFDDRVIRYLALVPVSEDLSPTREPCIRVAVQFFTHKMRHDVLSELSGILKARYLIHERIINHPTKSAAGAVLGSAVLLLGLNKLPAWVQITGDHEFINLLHKLSGDLLALVEWHESGGADQTLEAGVKALWPVDSRYQQLVQDCAESIVGKASEDDRGEWSDIRARARAARVVLWQLTARRLPKLAFRIRRSEIEPRRYRELAMQYSDPKSRHELEREIEYMCALPPGTVFIHCPRPLPGLKLAEVLMVGSDLANVRQLREVGAFSPDLKPYQDEINAVEDMYDSIWSMHCFLAAAHFDDRHLVAKYISYKLEERNDPLLAEELERLDAPEEWRLLCDEFGKLVAWAQWPTVIREVRTSRARHGTGDAKERLRAIIREETGNDPEQLELEV